MPRGGDSVYVLNPFFRLRDEGDHILVFGAQGVGAWRVHRSFGIVLSLCNGKRTAREIARLTQKFVKDGGVSDEERLSTALSQIKKILFMMSKSHAEQKGMSAKDTLSSDAPLIEVSVFSQKFTQNNYSVVEYDARDFLPSSDVGVASPPYQVKHDKVPQSIMWHLTSECITNCRYCYLKRRKVEPLGREKALSLVKEAATVGVCSLDLAGGDVLCYPYLFDVMEEMSKYQFLPFLFSTKCLLTREAAARLSSLKNLLLELQFSLDSDDGDIADFLVRSKGHVERMFQSIDNALYEDLPVSVKAVITPYNILTIPRFYRTLKDHGVQKIHLATYGRSGYYHTDDLFNHTESYEWLTEELEILRNEFPKDQISLQNGAPAFEPLDKESRRRAWGERIYCPAGHSSMMICSDGKVIPCEQMPETDEYFCGDVNEQSILEIWNGSRLKELTYGVCREKFIGTACYDCDEREECHHVKGYCIRDLALFHNNIYQPSLNCYQYNLPFVRQN